MIATQNRTTARAEAGPPAKCASFVEGRPPRRPRKALCITFLALCFSGVSILAATPDRGVKIKRISDRVRVEIGGKLFTEYRFGGLPKPCLYPILDDEGVSYTRDYPFAKNPQEDPDHVWHRGAWFAHGDVNGHDFWREIAEKKTGTIVHDTLIETSDGKTGLIRARNRWVAANGDVICTDETSIRIQRTDAGTIVDFDVTLIATHGPITIGDTEEGTMAVRVNEAIRVTHGRNKDKRPGTGRLVNSKVDVGIPAWGKRAEWCDYSGPLGDGRVIGIALFNHPQNHAHPTWWHARDYGLLSANPFGKHDFEKLKDQPRAGEVKLPAGGKLLLRYRMIFHRGDEKTARIAELYREYAQGK